MRFSFFFLVVGTSIGIGCAVGNIAPQYEAEELITEGLSIIKKGILIGNHNIMMDKSLAELGAVAAVHPQCLRLLHDFHHALQAVERWVNKGTNGVLPLRMRSLNTFRKRSRKPADMKPTLVSSHIWKMSGYLTSQ